MVNQMYLDKANVLIEALPYIQRFNRKIIVIKYGGSAMVDEELKRNVIQDVVLLKLVGFKPIIVHGGGKEISRWVGKVGMEPKFVNGLRVTDADTMEVAEMVLNKVNKELVTMIQSLGVNAVGISGKDGGLLNVEKKLSKGEDIGFVGNIKNVNPKVLYDLLDNDFLPVVCPVGMDDDFNTYNINADDDFFLQPFLGGYIALGVGGKIKNYADRTTSSAFDSDRFQRFDGGLRLGCGAEYNMIYAEVGFDLGIANVRHDDFEAAHTRSLFVNFGVNF